jgi:FkbM family methyltransferase
MNEKSLASLGRIAAAARRAGMQSVFAAVRNMLDAACRAANFPPLSVELDGVRLHGFLRHRSYLEELARGNYEPASRKLFRELLPSAEVFVDAGAHIGLYSMLAGRYGGPGLAVYALEPDPYNLRAFRWNQRLNRCRNVRLMPAAVADRTGADRFLISEGTIGSSLILGRTNIGPTHFLNVDTVSLDRLLQDVSFTAILVKLDIEGAEVRALQGMARTLQRAARTAVLCEINPEALAAGGRTPADLVAALRRAGLDVFFVSEADGGLIPADPPRNAKGNLLAVRHWPIAKDWILEHPASD